MSPKVLITDDAMFMRIMLKDILVKHGFEVVGEAENGAQAVAKFKELRPDIVTMDIVMPEMDGITALKNILGVDPSAKVIMCTAMGQQALVIEAMGAGAKDFITKPFSPAKVIETLRKFV